MLAIFDQIFQVADISSDLNKYKLRAHIARIIAKISIQECLSIENATKGVETARL